MLLVFDDMEACNNTTLKSALHSFMLDLLLRGRKHDQKQTIYQLLIFNIL